MITMDSKLVSYLICKNSNRKEEMLPGQPQDNIWTLSGQFALFSSHNHFISLYYFLYGLQIAKESTRRS